MEVSRVLVVAEPWIDYILDGSKTWEMRANATTHRGWFGLIRKGSGAVCGAARLVGVGSTLTPSEMLNAEHKHRIPAEETRSGRVAKWNTPWLLEDVCVFEEPVPYRHRSGAVTWVTLDSEAAAAVSAKLSRLVAALHEPRASARERRDVEMTPSP